MISRKYSHPRHRIRVLSRSCQQSARPTLRAHSAGRAEVKSLIRRDDRGLTCRVAAATATGHRLCTRGRTQGGQRERHNSSYARRLMLAPPPHPDVQTGRKIVPSRM
eukprot:scaffold285793_cov30-Tisochrysis_lutea.AAC.3